MLQVCFNKVTYLLTCNFPGETFVDEKMYHLCIP